MADAEISNKKLGNSLASEEGVDSTHPNVNVTLSDITNIESFKKFPSVNSDFYEGKENIESSKDKSNGLSSKSETETSSSKLENVETSKKVNRLKTLNSPEVNCDFVTEKTTKSLKKPPCVNYDFYDDDTPEPSLDVIKSLGSKTEIAACIKLEISDIVKEHSLESSELNNENNGVDDPNANAFTKPLSHPEFHEEKICNSYLERAEAENEASTKVNHSQAEIVCPVEHPELKKENEMLACVKNNEAFKNDILEIFIKDSFKISEINISTTEHKVEEKSKNLDIKQERETLSKLESSEAGKKFDGRLNRKKENSDIEKINPGLSVVGKIEQAKDKIDNTKNVVEGQISNRKRKNSETSKEHVTGNSNCKKENEVVAETKNTKSLEKASCSNYKFYDEEKGDIEHPEWDKVKSLSTNEERYRQVRACWDSRKVPNPNRNLTYQSFRKRRVFKGRPHELKAHKRQASSSFPDDHKSKRSRTRSCTFLIDNKISSTIAVKRSETEQLLRDKQNCKEALDRQFQNREKCLRNSCFNIYGVNYLPKHFDNELRISYHHQRQDIDRQFHIENERCLEEYESKIQDLKKVRKEMYQFYKFYKGLEDNGDPTFMTESQLQELDEIEHIYEQFDKFYGD